MGWEKLLDLLAKIAYARRGWKDTECEFIDTATRDVARRDLDSDSNVVWWFRRSHLAAVCVSVAPL